MTELHKLIVRLTGEDAGFKMMVSGATAALGTVSRAVGTVNSRITALVGGMRAFTGTTVSTLKQLGLASTLMGSVRAYDDYQIGIVRLEASIRSSGKSVDEVMPKYRAFAQHMHEATKYTKGQAMGLAGRATQMGYGGEEAVRVAKNAMALASGAINERHQNPDLMVRVADAMEKNDEAKIKRLLQLSKVDTESKTAMQVATERLAAGYEVLNKENDLMANKLEKATKILKWTGVEIGGLLSQALLPLIHVIEQVVKLVTQLDGTTKKWISGIVLAYIAWKTLKQVLTLVGSFMTILQIRQVALIGVAAIWKAATLAMVAIQWSMNTAIGVYHSLLAAATAFLVIYNTASLAGTATTWLWNQALLVWNGLITGGIGLVAGLTAAIVILGGGFGALVIVGRGVWEACKAVFDVFQDLGTERGPLEDITGVLKEWWEIIKHVAAAAQVNLPLAFQIAKVGIRIVVEDIKMLWPPLWEFLQEGWKVVADVAATAFKASFDSSIAHIKLAWEKGKKEVKDRAKELGTTREGRAELGSIAMANMNPLASAFSVAKFLFGGDEKDTVKEAEKVVEQVTQAATEQVTQTAQTGAERMQEALSKYGGAKGGWLTSILFPQEESEAKKAAKAEFDGLIGQLAELQKPETPEKSPLMKIADDAKKAAHEVKALEGALHGSAEAQYRIQEYKEKMTGQIAAGAAKGLPKAQRDLQIQTDAQLRVEKERGGQKDPEMMKQTKLLEKQCKYLETLAARSRGTLESGDDDTLDADLQD